MSARYRLTLAVEFTAGDDPAARLCVTSNMDALVAIGKDVRACTRKIPLTGAQRDANDLLPIKLKLQRLNDDVGAPPRSLVVEAL